MGKLTRACRCGSCRRCRNREAVRRYERSPKGRAALRRYRRSPKGRAVAARRRRRDRAKVRAREAVYRALKGGRLKRGPCARQGPECRGRIEAHHADYAKPLAVEWLCQHHHREAEREEQDA